MSKQTNPIVIIGAIIAIVLFAKYAGLFSTVNISSSQVQYNNKPIVMSLSTDLANPQIESFFNEQKVNVTLNSINSSYQITYSTTETGIFKVNLKSGNESLSQVIEVRKPFVDTKHNIPVSANRGDSIKIEVQTFNPQGELLLADSVDVDVYDPDNQKTTLFLDKEGNVFSKNFKFDKAGSYIFKIHARKIGYETKELSTITNVIKTSGIHPVVFIWLGAFIIWVIMFIWRRFR